jgi:tRNA-splicing ligase RtcB
MLDEFSANGLPAEQVADKTVRRALINAIVERTPTGPGRGQRSARKARNVGEALGEKVAIDGLRLKC